MGTSKGSDGPGPGVPLVPPHATADDPPQEDELEQKNADAPAPEIENAPRARFQQARAAAGAFIRDGGRDNLRKAVGHYVSKGYGGSAPATARTGHIVGSVGRLGDALAGAGSGTDADVFRDTDTSTLSANELISLIVDAAAPVDGTQDTELERKCMDEALGELLEEDEDADFTDLDDSQRTSVICSVLAKCVSGRFMLDNRKHLEERAINRIQFSERITEIREFIQESVRAQFRSAVPAQLPTGGKAFKDTVEMVLRTTFEVFESYLT